MTYSERKEECEEVQELSICPVMPPIPMALEEPTVELARQTFQILKEEGFYFLMCNVEDPTERLFENRIQFNFDQPLSNAMLCAIEIQKDLDRNPRQFKVNDPEGNYLVQAYIQLLLSKAHPNLKEKTQTSLIQSFTKVGMRERLIRIELINRCDPKYFTPENVEHPLLLAQYLLHKLQDSFIHGLNDEVSNLTRLIEVEELLYWLGQPGLLTNSENILTSIPNEEVTLLKNRRESRNLLIALISAGISLSIFSDNSILETVPKKKAKQKPVELAEIFLLYSKYKLNHAYPLKETWIYERLRTVLDVVASQKELDINEGLTMFGINAGDPSLFITNKRKSR